MLIGPMPSLTSSLADPEQLSDESRQMKAFELLPCLPRRARREGFRQGCRPQDPSLHPHRPTPQPATGELKVDADIRQRAAWFDLNVTLFYSSQSERDQEYGRGRSAVVAG